MKSPFRDVDELLESHVDQQMQTVDWDGLQDRIDLELEGAKQQEVSRLPLSWLQFVAAAAVILVLIGGGLVFRGMLQEPTMLELIETGEIEMGPMAGLTSNGSSLLDGVDPSFIICTENVHVLMNDPLLQPHSVWDQEQRLQ